MNKYISTPEFNTRVQQWAKSVNLQGDVILRNETHQSGTLQRSIDVKFRLDRAFDEHEWPISGLGFRFEKYGVYVHYGVGRGYIRVGGRIVRGHLMSKDAFEYGIAKGRLDRKSGRGVPMAGAVARHPINWIDGPIDQNIKSLADLAAEFYGDKALKRVISEYNRLKIDKSTQQ